MKQRHPQSRHTPHGGSEKTDTEKGTRARTQKRKRAQGFLCIYTVTTHTLGARHAPHYFIDHILMTVRALTALSAMCAPVCRAHTATHAHTLHTHESGEYTTIRSTDLYTRPLLRLYLQLESVPASRRVWTRLCWNCVCGSHVHVCVCVCIVCLRERHTPRPRPERDIR